MKFLKGIFLLLITFSLSSCVGDLDFDQVDELEIEPYIALELGSFEFSTEDYDIPENSPIIPIITDVPDIVQEIALSDLSLVRDNLESLVFKYTATNSFTGSFTFNMVLYDVSGQVTYDDFEEVVIPELTDDFSGEFEIDLALNPEITDSYWAVGFFTYNGQSIDLSQPQALAFNAAGDFYTKID